MVSKFNKLRGDIGNIVACIEGMKVAKINLNSMLEKNDEELENMMSSGLIQKLAFSVHENSKKLTIMIERSDVCKSDWNKK